MSADADLNRLAEICGIKPNYTDAHGRQYVVSPETKRALLHALAVDASSPGSIRASLHDLDQEQWSQIIPRASVIHQGCATIEVRGENINDYRTLVWSINTGSQQERHGECRWGDLPVLARETHDGMQREARSLRCAGKLEAGYHSICIDMDGRRVKGALIVAPGQCYFPDEEPDRLPWGIAVQLYGLRSKKNWGIGDFGDLATAAELFSTLGADTVSISPVHASFPADPGHFGPYGPSSRLFLNIMHISVTDVPGFGFSQGAQNKQAEVAAIISEARAADLVNYHAVARSKMAVLEELRTWLVNSTDQASRAAFETFKVEQGRPLFDHAVFDALHEHFFKSDSPEWSWRKWPLEYRSADMPDVAGFARANPDRIDFFMYLQWLADRQLGEAHRRARDAGMKFGVFRDLAVGTDTSGAMAWINSAVVLNNATIGAPPDAFNHLGQNWGITGLSPRGLIASGFEPFIAMLRANMRHAGALRIDHVMGLERLFIIPAGAKASEGAYLAYPADDLRKLLSLESQRQKCAIVGEDLGTVPPGFRKRLGDSGVLTYKVVYFERDSEGSFVDPRSYIRDCLVSASTHDLPPVAGFWTGRDIEWRRRIGELPDDAAYAAALTERAKDKSELLKFLVRCGQVPADADVATVDPGQVIKAIYGALSTAPSRMLMVLSEDLLLTAEQPNLPGTYDEHPNWRRKLPLDLEDFLAQPSVIAISAAVRRGRARQ